MNKVSTTGWLRTGVAVLLLVIMLFPVYWMVNSSLQGSENMLSTAWFPVRLQLDGFADAVDTQLPSLLTSVTVALGAVIICLAIAAPAAYGLSRTGIRLPGGGLFLIVLLITQMVPGIVIANGIFPLYNKLQLVDSYLGLVLADASLAIPFCILLMRAFMINIPNSLLEAARIDGAGEVGIFLRIVLPISRNVLVTGALFAFLFAWSDFLFALTLTSGDSIVPITLSMYRFVGAHTQSWSSLMATATLASIPAAVLLIVAQKYIASGVTGGAVK